MNLSQRDATLDIYDRHMSSNDAGKSVLNSPCVDKFNGKCLSRDGSKAVISDRYGRPKGDRKRNNDKKGGQNNHNGGQNGGPNKKSKKGQADNVSELTDNLDLILPILLRGRKKKGKKRSIIVVFMRLV